MGKNTKIPKNNSKEKYNRFYIKNVKLKVKYLDEYYEIRNLLYEKRKKKLKEIKKINKILDELKKDN